MLVTPGKTWNDGLEPLNHRKPLKFRCFSHQSGTVGLPIVNEAYHAHDRALHFGTRCAAVLRQLYLCEFLELELHIRDSTCRRCLLTACAISAMRRQRARSNPPRPREIFESDMLQPVTCLREPDHIWIRLHVCSFLRGRYTLRNQKRPGFEEISSSRCAQYILKLSRSKSEESYDLHQGLAFFAKTCHILPYLVISCHFLSWSM